MNKKQCIFLCFSVGFIMNAPAENVSANQYGLMTAHDMRTNAVSNVTITNGTGQAVTATGLFIASLDTASGSDNCNTCYASVIGGDNLVGAIPSTILFQKNQSLAIGQNYLYNMLYNYLYFVKNNGSSPCALPGCTWPGDAPDTHGWCIGINATSLDTNYTYSNYKNGAYSPANIPPYSAAGTSSPYDYNYDLINPSIFGTGSACIGPIICNDKTLTCQVETAQNETFSPYVLKRS